MHLLKVEAKSCAVSFCQFVGGNICNSVGVGGNICHIVGVGGNICHALLLVEKFVKGNSASELLLDRQPLQKVPSAVTPSVHFSPTW